MFVHSPKEPSNAFLDILSTYQIQYIMMPIVE